MRSFVKAGLVVMVGAMALAHPVAAQTQNAGAVPNAPAIQPWVSTPAKPVVPSAPSTSAAAPVPQAGATAVTPNAAPVAVPPRAGVVSPENQNVGALAPHMVPPTLPISALNKVEITVLGVDPQGNTAVDVNIPGRKLSRRIPSQTLLACSTVQSSKLAFGPGAQSSAGLVSMGRQLAQQNVPGITQADLDQLAVSFAQEAQKAILVTIDKCHQAGLIR